MPVAASSTAASPTAGAPAARTGRPGSVVVDPASCTVQAGRPGVVISAAAGEGPASRAARSASSTARVAS